MLSASFAQELKPTDTEALFNVVATSKSGNPRQGEIIVVVSQKTKKSYQGTTGPEGKCAILLPKADKYDIQYKYFGQMVKYRELEIPAEPNKRTTFTFTMKYDPPKTFVLKNVFFDTGKSTLRKESFPALNELADALKSKPGMVIEIAGHTDNVGSPDANLKLSEDRAGAVRDYLVKNGIAAARVSAKGYGETQPVADNETAEGKQQNRRTEVRIINE